MQYFIGSRFTRQIVTTSAVVVACAGAPNASFAQNALGGGTVLDHNLNTQSGGINAVTPQPDFRSRNLLITGNVVGGRGFRGSVGYTAPLDFRDGLGSNELYRFRADSALSNPELFRLGSTYERLRFGQDLGVLAYTRSGTGATPTTIAQPETLTRSDGVLFTRGQTMDTRVRADRANLAGSTPFTLALASEPRAIGLTYSQEGTPMVFNASNVRGLTIERADQQAGVIGLTSFDMARVRSDVERGAKPPALGQPFDTRFEQALGDSLRVEAAADAGRVEGAIGADYRRILESIVDRYGQATQGTMDVDPQLLRQLDQEYRGLRAQLRGSTLQESVLGGMDGTGLTEPTDRTATAQLPGMAPDRTGQPGMAQGPGQPGRLTLRDEPSDRSAAAPSLTPGEREPVVVDPLQPQPGQPAPADDAASGVFQPKPMSLEEFGVILRHGEAMQQLSGPGEDRFNELMRAGEQALRDGDYFTAERRFERALRFTPGHPLAILGAAHSQLGAGLYLSSAITLRNLYMLHPEMIDVSYAEHLLPPRERLDAAVRTLRSRLDDPTDRAGYAFAIAYIGRQINQRELIEEGLNELDQAQPDDPMVKLLREVWLGARTPANPER